MEERVPVPGFGFFKPKSRDYIETRFQVCEQIRLNGLMSWLKELSPSQVDNVMNAVKKDLILFCNCEFVEVINQKHNQCDFCFCQAPGLDKHKSLQNGGLSAPLANAACKAFCWGEPLQCSMHRVIFDNLHQELTCYSLVLSLLRFLKASMWPQDWAQITFRLEILSNQC